MKNLLIVIITLCAFSMQAQSVKNTSYISRTGEKVLRLEATLPVDLAEAWKLFTTDDKLKLWIAPLAHIELKTGGYFLTNYDTAKSLTDSTAIRLDIVNYIDMEQLTLKVNLNDKFPGNVKNEDENLQEIIQLKYIFRKQ